MKLEHLRGRKICDRVIRKGKMWRGKTMIIRWMPGAPFHPAADKSKCALYVGTLASTKLDKSAVKRNRMRRRCREALRIAVLETQQNVKNSSEGVGLAGPTPGGLHTGKGEPVRGKPLGFPFTSVQLLICPLSASLMAPFGDIENDVRRFLSQLPSWPTPRSAPPVSSISH